MDGGEVRHGEVALQVDADDVVPVGLVHVEAHLVPQDPGVVDQDVELAPGVDGLGHQALGARPGAHVVGVEGGLAPGGDDVVDRLLGGVDVRCPRPCAAAPDVVDDDLGALGGEEQRLLASDAPPCAGDDGDLAVEHAHLETSSDPEPGPGARAGVRRHVDAGSVNPGSMTEGAHEGQNAGPATGPRRLTDTRGAGTTP